MASLKTICSRPLPMGFLCPTSKRNSTQKICQVLAISGYPVVAGGVGDDERVDGSSFTGLNGNTMSLLYRCTRSIPSCSRPTRSLHTTRPAREHFLNATEDVSGVMERDSAADSQAFKQRVLNGSSPKPILVDFYAE